MTTARFDVTLHPLPSGAIAGPPLTDPWGTWPTIELPKEAAGLVMAGGFDAALERLAKLDRLYVEPDGSFVVEKLLNLPTSDPAPAFIWLVRRVRSSAAE